MKKLFLLLLVLPLAFMACSSDDKEKEPKDPDKMTPEEYMSKDHPFKWNGDWNDPEDPKYKEYNGKYNPLAGTYWISKENPETVQCYSKDFEYIVYKYDTENKTLEEYNTTPYIINDKGYKSEFYGYDFFFMTDDKKILYMNARGAAVGEGNLIYKKDWFRLDRFYPNN